MLKVFGQAGVGIFPVPTAIESNVKKQYGVGLVGRIPEVLDKFYAISVEKRVQHDATSRIVNVLGDRPYGGCWAYHSEKSLGIRLLSST